MTTSSLTFSFFLIYSLSQHSKKKQLRDTVACVPISHSVLETSASSGDKMQEHRRRQEQSKGSHEVVASRKLLHSLTTVINWDDWSLCCSCSLIGEGQAHLQLVLERVLYKSLFRQQK